MKKMIGIALLLTTASITVAIPATYRVVLCNYSKKYTLEIKQNGLQVTQGGNDPRGSVQLSPTPSAYACKVVKLDFNEPLYIEAKSGDAGSLAFPTPDGRLSTIFTLNLNTYMPRLEKPDVQSGFKNIWLLDAGKAFFTGTLFTSISAKSTVKIKQLTANPKLDNAIARFKSTFQYLPIYYKATYPELDTQFNLRL